tara:strand:- start:2049 stop:2831 length:783 start_codon:yes stop_codon:yes gene_type:complete
VGNLKVSPIISIKDVDKSFGSGTLAVSGMTLNIFKNQFISFLGPSGCGKSTLLKMISGLLRPTTGSIKISGNQNHNMAISEDIGFVFQDATLMPWSTVQDNVFLPLRLKGFSRKQASEEIEKILVKVGLKDFRRSYPRELSGGMKMRVSIARALITKPSLLLMDEPFAALDEMTRFKLNNDVLSFWENTKLTVIFVTHSVFESVYLSNRVVVMAPRPGRVVADIALDENYPRTDEYRTTPEYAEKCRLVSSHLQSTIIED